MSKESKDVVVEVTNEELAVLMQQGGGGEQANAVFPAFRLEHTTDFDGNDNPLKGHFTITTRNELGEWLANDLGETIEMQILMRRYRLDYKPKGGETEYSTREFDSLMDQVPLTKKTIVGENKKFELFATGTAHELKQHPKFQTTKDDGSIKSELQLLSVLYCKVGDAVVRFKTNISATISFNNYSKQVMPFGVITQVTPEEMKNGTVRYFKPNFKAVRPLTKEEITKTIELQKELRKVFSLVSGGTVPQNQLDKPTDASGNILPELPSADGLETIPF